MPGRDGNHVLQISLSLFSVSSATFALRTHRAIPSVIFSLGLPLLRFQSIILAVTRHSIFSHFITRPRQKMTCFSNFIDKKIVLFFASLKVVPFGFLSVPFSVASSFFCACFEIVKGIGFTSTHFSDFFECLILLYTISSFQNC